MLGPMASRSSEKGETNGQANRKLLQTLLLKGKNYLWCIILKKNVKNGTFQDSVNLYISMWLSS